MGHEVGRTVAWLADLALTWPGAHLCKRVLGPLSQVVIYERSASMFSGSSGYNQFRLHLGFHYPRRCVGGCMHTPHPPHAQPAAPVLPAPCCQRSSKTRHQIIDSHERFLAKYPNLFFPVRPRAYHVLPHQPT